MIAWLGVGFGASSGGKVLEAIVGYGAPAQIEYTTPSVVSVLIPAMTDPHVQYVCGPGAIVPVLVVLLSVSCKLIDRGTEGAHWLRGESLLDKTAISQRTNCLGLDGTWGNSARRWSCISARIITGHGWILVVGILAGTPSSRRPRSSSYVTGCSTSKGRCTAGRGAVCRILSYAIIRTVCGVDGSARLGISIRLLWISTGFGRWFCGRRERCVGGGYRCGLGA